MALSSAFTREDGIDEVLLHTGQHYDERMSDVFFRQLELPEPDVYLGVGSGSHAEQTARVMLAFERARLAASPQPASVGACWGSDRTSC